MILIISKDLTRVKQCRTLHQLEMGLLGLDNRNYMLFIPESRGLPPRVLAVPSPDIAVTVNRVKFYLEEK